jgi:hypothetical protein
MHTAQEHGVITVFSFSVLLTDFGVHPLEGVA